MGGQKSRKLQAAGDNIVRLADAGFVLLRFIFSIFI